jgi:two-component system, cell cycle response regulator
LNVITVVTKIHEHMSRCYEKPWTTSRNDSGSESDFLRRELAELDFLVSFARGVSASLDTKEILKTAARLFQSYFHYSIVVFSLAEGFGGLTAYSPLDPEGCRRGWIKANGRFPTLKYREISGYRALDLATPAMEDGPADHEVNIELADNCGIIRIFCSEERAFLGTNGFRRMIGESLASALKNAREHDRVKELSLRDGLTGLYNRRVLEEILLLEKNKRKPSITSVLLIDVDDFKMINDTFGHPAGDRVLKVIGGLLMENTRKENIVARYGGEEFALLLTNTDLETALQIAERLRIRLGEEEFEFSGNRFRLSVSIGVSSNGGSAQGAEGMISRADQALYNAKRNGKNRVCSLEAPVLSNIPEKRRRPLMRYVNGSLGSANMA